MYVSRLYCKIQEGESIEQQRIQWHAAGWSPARECVIFPEIIQNTYITIDGNTRVTLICLSRLITIFIAQSYINYIQISVGIIFHMATDSTERFLLKFE